MMCQYKELFGKPNEGVHKYRLFGVAAVDLIGTIVIAWLVARWIKKSFWIVFVSAMAIAVLLHKLFCVKTALNEKIGL